jgi:DNA-binding MarR family transcriptional regulator
MHGWKGAMSRITHDPVEWARQYWLEMGWTDTVSGMTVVSSIMRADQIFMNQANGFLRPLGLTFARYEVLGILNSYGAAPLGVIAQHLWITPATVTSNVDRLEAAGLCRRRADPNDARTTLAEITPKGRRVFDRAVEAVNTKVFAAVTLSDNEARQLVKLIAKIRRSVGDMVGVPPSEQSVWEREDAPPRPQKRSPTRRK